MTDEKAIACACFQKDAVSARRNSKAIIDVLINVLPRNGNILEIGSGTGQHALLFSRILAPRLWIPSDPDSKQRASINAWANTSTQNRPLQPRNIDATSKSWDVSKVDKITSVVCINVIHISPWIVSEGLIEGSGRVLPKCGILYLYGPFKRSGRHISQSNADFDSYLQRQNKAWGVRDLDEIEMVAKTHGFYMDQIINMPSNNFSLVFKHL